MALLEWSLERNLENSLADFLQSEITTQNLTVLDPEGNLITPQVVVGFQKTEDWYLPNISVYSDSISSPRLSVGSNKRQDGYLLVIDIRACDIGSQLDLTDWVKLNINDGWDFYEWQPNSGSPDNPTKIKVGYVSFNFISNTPIRLGENIDIFDKYRQNITIDCTVTPTN